MDQAAACWTFTRLADGADWTARQRAASAVAELGLLTRDPRGLTHAIGRWSQLRDAPGMTQGQRAELYWQHGRTLTGRVPPAARGAAVADDRRDSRPGAGRDPASPGFLAVLSACTTDLANVDHDEALTLASALLAAGACGVIGARWPVEDSAAAPVMVMFHHFLNNGHPYPAEALRAAQLWMLGGGNEPPACGAARTGGRVRSRPPARRSPCLGRLHLPWHIRLTSRRPPARTAG